MTNIDPRVTQAIAEGRVPAQFTAAFLSESRDGPSIAGICFVASLTFIIVCARLAARAFVLHRVGVDDGLALVSLVLFVAFVGLCIKLILLGSGRHFAFITYVLPDNVVLETEALDFTAHIIYTTALLLCRISGLAFYHRICGTHKKFALAIKVVFGIVIAGYLPQIFLLIFHCLPVTAYWPYSFEPLVDKFTCLQWGLVYSVNSSVSLLCDFLLFGIPIAMLRVLDMPQKRKVQLACILLPGIAVIAISIARLILVILGQWEVDESWSYDPMLGVETSEIGATLIALSLPGAKPLVDKFIFKKDDSQTGGSKYGYGAKASRGTALTSLGLHSQSENSILANHEDSAKFGAEASATSGNQHSNDNAEGIYVRVDFDVKEARIKSDATIATQSVNSS